nr:MAG TPA: hypothetical protein [Caudoviricetes sp.]DAZ78305.1 MAG TPA: hypothetical protein [Caudoviricetes sp.]
MSLYKTHKSIGTYSFILPIEVYPYTCYNKITVRNTKQPGGAANLRRKKRIL